MLLFIATIALLNLGLGMGVAVVLSHDWPDLASLLAQLRGRFKRVAAAEKPAVAEVHPSVEPATAAAASEDEAIHVAEQPRVPLPETWQERLLVHEVKARSVFEAALQLIRAEDEAHRSRWITAEQSVRASAKRQDETTAEKSLAPLRIEATTWLEWARPLLEQLKNCRESFGDQQAVSNELEELLLSQLSSVESFLDVPARSELDAETTTRRRTHEFSAIFEKSYALRDAVLDRLARLLVAEGRGNEIPADWQKDSETAYANRLGLEQLLTECRGEDPTTNPSCAALIEIDRLGKLNERLGVRQTNQVVRSFAKLVEGVVRSDRGDRVARVAGPTIFVLMADVSPEGGQSVAERIRQTVEAATFEARSEEFTLAANCSVCGIDPSESTSDLLVRLKRGISEAKRGGRNRTAVDVGEGPHLFDPDPIQVKAQLIKVEQG